MLQKASRVGCLPPQISVRRSQHLPSPASQVEGNIRMGLLCQVHVIPVGAGEKDGVTATGLNQPGGLGGMATYPLPGSPLRPAGFSCRRRSPGSDFPRFGFFPGELEVSSYAFRNIWAAILPQGIAEIIILNMGTPRVHQSKQLLGYRCNERMEFVRQHGGMNGRKTVPAIAGV